MTLRRLILLAAMLGIATTLSAQGPLYVVNGEVVKDIDNIPHEDIESIDVLPADEQSIAEWGDAASEGVILVTLRYDTPARFTAEGFDNFTDYMCATVRWNERMPAERVSLRLVIDTEGRASIGEVLQITSRQFLKRVEQALASAPRWTPATRNGKAVESIHLVNIQLPVGKQLPVEQGIILL